VSLAADAVIAQIRKSTQDPELRGLIAQLGLDPDKLKFKGGKGDLVSIDHGITLIFHEMAGGEAASKKKLGQFTDVQFSARGYQGGPPFAGELPRGIRFSMNRDQVYTILGQPVAKAMLGIPNERWDHGDKRYFTLDFVDDYSSIKKLTVGTL
jgi:hypothetical protein